MSGRSTNKPADCTNLAAQRRLRRFALALFLFFTALYGLTGSKLRFGYEGENIGQAEAILRGRLTQRPQHGGIAPFSKGGVLEVAAYLPFTATKLALEKRNILPGVRQIAYVFALPFYTALTLLVFFGLALELYRKPETAAALTLITGLATTVWPYAKFGMETQQTLWTLAALWALVRYHHHRPSAGAAAAFGLALAALALTKITGPLHAAMFALAWLWLFGRERLWRRRAALGHLLVIFFIGLVGVLVFLLSNHWRYGGWLWGGRYGYAHEMTPYPLLEGIWAVWFSPGKSIFLFSPALIVGLWYWGRFGRRFPPLRLILALLILLALFHIHLKPWADETWGPRRLHYLAPILALPIGIWLEERMRLRAWLRMLGLAVLCFGVWVQLVAVCFDYTALAKAVGRSETFSLENTVWEPQLCPLRFNIHLLASNYLRHTIGRSMPFVYESQYLPWTEPPQPPGPKIFPVSGLDTLDFWFLQQRADWAGKPYWFVSPTSYLPVLLALTTLLSGAWLVRRGMREEGKRGKENSEFRIQNSE